MSPLVSIIIPCYNHGIYIEEAIYSINKISDKPEIEIIIVNDGSTDDYTLKKLKILEKKGYYVINQKNLGLPQARNNAIALSKGEFFIPLGAYDKLRDGYLKKGINIFHQNPKIGIIYGNAYHYGKETRLFKPGKFSYKGLLKENYIASCAMIRKSVWENVNGYDINLTSYEDWDFYLSAATAGWKFHYIPEIMFEYRILRNSMLRSHIYLNDCVNYIAKKHGILYRNEFLRNITIKDRIKSISIDLFKKIIGRPNY